jgi:hypothetical protein
MQMVHKFAHENEGGVELRIRRQRLLPWGLAHGLQHQAAEGLLHRIDMEHPSLTLRYTRHIRQGVQIGFIAPQGVALGPLGMGRLDLVFHPLDSTF